MRKLRLAERGIGPLALLVAAMLAAPVAAADGVVVKSTSTNYPVGVLVKDGEALRLEAGQTVTILDRSGAVIQRTAGAYTGPSAREHASFAQMAAALAAGPQPKSAIGGTRPAEEEDCSLSTAAATDACTPHGVAGRRLRVTGYTPAHGNVAPQLVVQSNFDGYAVCVGWNSPAEDSRFIPGSDPVHPLELSATQPARLGPPPSGASNPSLKSISCTGFSAEVWNALRVSALQALDPNSAAIVLSSFSKLQGDTIAEGRATASARP